MSKQSSCLCTASTRFAAASFMVQRLGQSGTGPLPRWQWTDLSKLADCVAEQRVLSEERKLPIVPSSSKPFHLFQGTGVIPAYESPLKPPLPIASAPKRTYSIWPTVSRKKNICGRPKWDEILHVYCQRECVFIKNIIFRRDRAFLCKSGNWNRCDISSLMRHHTFIHLLWLHPETFNGKQN